MKIITAFSNWFIKASRNFTLLMLALLPIVAALSADLRESNEVPGLNFSQIMLILAFSAAAALGSCVSLLIKKNTVVRECVKFVIDYAAFMLIFTKGLGKGFLNSQSTNQVRTITFFTLAFVILYAVVAGVCALYRSIFKKALPVNQTYQKQFEAVSGKESDNK